jgi:hypothetical protein
VWVRVHPAIVPAGSPRLMVVSMGHKKQDHADQAAVTKRSDPTRLGDVSLAA